jgi:hypothetical protein
MIDNALQPMEFAMNNLEPGGEMVTRARGQSSEILFKQLDVNIQRAERITNFVGQPRQQSFQKISLLRHSDLGRVLAQGFCQYTFHWQPG